MERRDNYVIAAAQARQLFLQYDQEAVSRKPGVFSDEQYLYAVMLGETYRIHRTTGEISRFYANQWIIADSFNESLTLLDLVCDSRADHHPAGRWKAMQDFGLQFHRQYYEIPRDSRAAYYEANAANFAAACRSLGGMKYHLGDEAYSIEVFDGLHVLVQLWFGDEEFPAQLRWLWDENALQYLKYETMYYAVGLILSRIDALMQ